MENFFNIVQNNKKERNHNNNNTYNENIRQLLSEIQHAFKVRERRHNNSFEL